MLVRAGVERWAGAARAAVRLPHGADDYPALLASIDQPPPLLHVRGDAALLRAPAVAVVGSRRATREGLLFAERLAADLAARDLVVVSGLALGIDAAAHRGALATGSTVAVLASGIDLPSPWSHRELYERIAGAGCVVSEFEPGTPALKHHFLQRNRLISGLALGTVVVEAAERSGALITARHAREQGREVFAVPGSPLSTTSGGANALLRDGAALVRGWRDVLDELAPRLEALVEAGLVEPLVRRRTRVARASTPGPDSLAGDLLRHLGDAPIHVDDLRAACGKEVSSLLAELSELEITGLVRQLPGKFFVRSPAAR